MLADHNINSAHPTAIAQRIQAACDASAAVNAVDAYFSTSALTPRTKKRITDCRRIAVAYYDRNPEGGTAKVKAGPGMSQFASDAADLDGNAKTTYWASAHEMFARAFQSYLEDSLAVMGRKNDYLSAFADNKYHYDALFNIQWKPYPEGEERKRINNAFDILVEALRKDGTLAKAIAMFDEEEDAGL